MRLMRDRRIRETTIKTSIKMINCELFSHNKFWISIKMINCELFSHNKFLNYLVIISFWNYLVIISFGFAPGSVFKMRPGYVFGFVLSYVIKKHCYFKFCIL